MFRKKSKKTLSLFPINHPRTCNSQRATHEHNNGHDSLVLQSEYDPSWFDVLDDRDSKTRGTVLNCGERSEWTWMNGKVKKGQASLFANRLSTQERVRLHCPAKDRRLNEGSICSRLAFQSVLPPASHEHLNDISMNKYRTANASING